MEFLEDYGVRHDLAEEIRNNNYDYKLRKQAESELIAAGFDVPTALVPPEDYPQFASRSQAMELGITPNAIPLYEDYWYNPGHPITTKGEFWYYWGGLYSNQCELRDAAVVEQDAIKRLYNSSSLTNYGCAYLMFGERYQTGQYHKAMDVYGPSNSNFYAISSGTVMNDPNDNTYGFLVLQDTTRNIISVYMHAQQYYVSQGDYVSVGDLLGKQGAVGTGSQHVHFGIQKIPQTYTTNIWQYVGMYSEAMDLNTSQKQFYKPYSYLKSYLSPHSHTFGSYSTSTVDGTTIYKYICTNSACDSYKQDTHLHSFGLAWAYDASYHFKMCTVSRCGETAYKAPHTFSNGVCTVCGFGFSK